MKSLLDPSAKRAERKRPSLRRPRPPEERVRRTTQPHQVAGSRSSSILDEIGELETDRSKFATNPQYGLKSDLKDLASMRLAGDQPGDGLSGRRVEGRRGPRAKPVYKRPKAEGELRADGIARRMVFGWVGETHCLFVIPGTNAPAIGDTVEVGIPGQPLTDGLIWVGGLVSQLTIDEVVGRTKVEVDLEVQGATVPSVYRRLVEHAAIVG